jgi:hypothetical protein
MPKPTEKQILDAAIQQVEAMLLFASVENGMGKSGKPSRPSRYRQIEVLKNLMHLADVLNGKIDEWPHCEACGKPIKARQAYLHDSEDGLDFHTRCMHMPASKGIRMDTPAYFRREMVKRAEEVRRFLRKKGVVA